jgi:hypothetical protein
MKKGLNHLKKVLFTVVSFVIFVILSPSISNAATFSDIEGSKMKEQIEALAADGIITGRPDGTFRPKDKVTRVEFAKILALAMNIPLDANAAKKFSDVPLWARPYVGALVNEGITNGKSATRFGATDYISRQEMAVMFVRAMGLEEFVLIMDLEPNFADFNQVSQWARPHVAFAKEIGFIEGNGISFFPKNASVREAVAKLTYQWKYEEHLFFERALNVIGTWYFEDIDQITLSDDMSVIDILLLDGTVLQADPIVFLDGIYSTYQYDSLALLNGYEWIELTNAEKVQIVSFVIEFWDSPYSEFEVIGNPDEAVNMLITQLNSYYENEANRSNDIITQLETFGLDTNIIQYYVESSSLKKGLRTLFKKR